MCSRFSLFSAKRWRTCGRCCTRRHRAIRSPTRSRRAARSGVRDWCWSTTAWTTPPRRRRRASDWNALAQAADIRITRLEHFEDSVVERYATVLLTGLFGAAYLQIGLGRTPS